MSISDSRRVRRGHLEDRARIEMLEDDADDFKSEIHGLRSDVSEEFKWLRRALIGCLLGIPMATIAICVTIVLSATGG